MRNGTSADVGEALILSSAGDRGTKGEDIVKNGTESVDVGAFVHGVEAAVGLLGGHEGGSAHDGAVAGAFLGAWLGGIDQTGLVRLSLVKDFGEAPVHNEHLAAFAKHDIGGLKIAVKDVAGMGVGDGVADFLE